MPKSSFVDFKAVKAVLTMEQVLDHYGLSHRFKRSGDSLSGPCPIHKGENPTQFRISLSKNVWNCFSECKHGGNTLDFIAKMENVSIHAAALKAVEWFHLDPEAMAADSEQEAERPEEAPRRVALHARGRPLKQHRRKIAVAPISRSSSGWINCKQIIHTLPNADLRPKP
jgi:DNA primase